MLLHFHYGISASSWPLRVPCFLISGCTIHHRPTVEGVVSLSNVIVSRWVKKTPIVKNCLKIAFGHRVPVLLLTLPWTSQYQSWTSEQDCLYFIDLPVYNIFISILAAKQYLNSSDCNIFTFSPAGLQYFHFFNLLLYDMFHFDLPFCNTSIFLQIDKTQNWA